MQGFELGTKLYEDSNCKQIKRKPRFLQRQQNCYHRRIFFKPNWVLVSTRNFRIIFANDRIDQTRYFVVVIFRGNVRNFLIFSGTKFDFFSKTKNTEYTIWHEVRVTLGLTGFLGGGVFRILIVKRCQLNWPYWAKKFKKRQIEIQK